MIFPYYQAKAAGRTAVWFAINGGYGLAPFLLMLVLKYWFKNESAAIEIQHHINDGLILFVFAAIMGSVVVDILYSSIQFSRLTFFAATIYPFIVIGTLLLIYTLIVVKVFHEDYFSHNWGFGFYVIGSAIIYCIFAKYNLYLVEVKNGK